MNRDPQAAPSSAGPPAYVDANRALWDEYAEINYASDWYDVAGVKQGRSKLRPYEIDDVGDVTGKRLLHLQCQIGTDTVAWARRGAVATGVDLSPRAVALASKLAGDMEIDARFVCSDVMRLPDHLTGEFDIVYASRGVLSWIPDLPQWAWILRSFTAAGGFVYVTDVHPIARALGDAPDRLELTRRYWPDPEPVASSVDGCYADPEATVTSQVKYQWTHSVGELITSLAQAGFVIEFFREFAWLDRPRPFLTEAPDRTWTIKDGVPGEAPLFFALRARTG